MNKKIIILLLLTTVFFVSLGVVSATSDLNVTKVNVTDKISQGGSVTINTTIKNNGTNATGGFYVGYYIQNEKTVVKKPGTQTYPAIYGNRIVWQDNRNGNDDIYMKDLSTGVETVICNNSAAQWYPAIYGDRVVWQDNRNGNFDIYMYDLSTGLETQITNNSANQFFPAIYGDKIVWQDDRNYSTTGCDIYMKDLSTGFETVICSSTADQRYPAIYGDRIVWYDSNADIYMKDLSTGLETQITSNTAVQYFPAIYGDRIVWQDNRNGNFDIYMYDLSTGLETQITNNSANQINPAIYGDKIVWQDDRNGNFDIYMHDLSTGLETQITSNIANQMYPAIYGDRIVWHDTRNDNGSNINYDIYMTDGPIPLTEVSYVPSLAVGASTNILTTVKLPNNLELGVNYYFGAIADVTGYVTESNESNNAAIDPTPAVMPDVNLIGQNVNVPASGVLGSNIVIPNTVKNTGTENSQPFYVSFYLSKDKSLSSSDIYLGKRYVTGLAGGSTNTAYTPLLIPKTTAVGSYYIIASVDSGSNAAETNEFNNVLVSSSLINVIAPDLTPTSINGPTTGIRGHTISLSSVVKNQGTLASGGFTVKYYLSRDSNITSSDVYLGQAFISGLGVGASVTINPTFKIPTGITAGKYYIGMIVDTGGNVTESNELNNVRYKTTVITIS